MDALALTSSGSAAVVAILTEFGRGLTVELEKQAPAVAAAIDRWDKLLAPIVRKVVAIGDHLLTSIRDLEGAPAVPGIQEYFVSKGDEPGLARLKAHWLVNRARQAREEDERARTLASATRAITKLKTPSTLTVSRRAIDLQNASNAGMCALFTRACDAAGFAAHGLPELFQAAAGRDPQSCQRLVTLCKKVVPHLRDPRGRRLLPASIEHQMLLALNQGIYTFSELEDDYTDPLTHAMRKWSGRSTFNPTSGRRRMRARDL